jgi:hypothetical protein
MLCFKNEKIKPVILISEEENHGTGTSADILPCVTVFRIRDSVLFYPLDPKSGAKIIFLRISAFLFYFIFYCDFRTYSKNHFFVTFLVLKVAP